MKSLQSDRSAGPSACAAILILLSLASAGCDDMAGAAMEYALDNSSDAAPDSLASKLKAEQAQCPRQINEHTTLKSVSLRGVNRVKYLYVVTESGRPEVNMTRQFKIRKEVIERTKSSHLGPSIVKHKLGVDHFFQDADGKCLLWLEMSSKDFEGIEFEEPQSIAKASVPEKPINTEADRNQMLAELKAEQAECPRKIDEHTTLKKITLKGKNRIKYHYEVSASGRKVVNMNNEAEIRRQVIERTNESPLGASIVKLDVGVEHFFQDVDGQCTLWLQMTKKDFVGGKADKNGAQEVAASESTESKTPVTTWKPKMPAKFKDLFGGNQDNPPGVQTNPYAL